MNLIPFSLWQLRDALDVTYVLGCVDIFDALDGFGTICDSMHYFVVRRDFRIRNVLVLELYSVAESFGPCIFDVTLVGAIVFWGSR